MNLIERLGGYENAKGLFNLYEYTISFKYYKDFKGDFESAGYIDVFIPALQKAILEYRRQHNIFESDDLVTSKKWVDGSIHKIELVDSEDRTLKIFSHDMAFSYWVDSRNYRHATDAEIKVGKRLEVNDEY